MIKNKLLKGKNRQWAIASGLFFMVLFISAACIPFVKPAPIGNSPPVIDEYFASPKARWGETYKIYIKAHDPDGDMWEARFNIEQPGTMYSDIKGDVRLPREFWMNMNGFFYMQLPWDAFAAGFLQPVITLTIADRGDRKSRTLRFPLSLGTQPQSPPPQGFANQPIVPIPFNLRGDSNRF